MDYLYLTALILLVLIVTKLYFRGGSCKITRDLTGKVAVITGGNTGIGKVTAIELAKKNCTVVIGARDKKKCEETIKEIKQIVANATAEYISLDLASKKSIEQFAGQIKKTYKTVDILINNAGVTGILNRKTTEDGFEFQMGVNHFGHFYLTYLLYQNLIKSDAPRIINVSSDLHRYNFMYSLRQYDFPLDFDDIDAQKHYNLWQAYGKSKLANVLFTKEMAKSANNSGRNLKVVALHPGAVRTQIMRKQNLGVLLYVAYILARPFYYLFSRSTEMGAQTILYCSFQQHDQLINGGYYKECKIAGSSRFAANNQNCRRLWEISESRLGVKFNVF